MRGAVLSGRYRLDDVLGSGGMGEVWRADDLVLRRPVAVKLLHQAGDADVRERERFRREAQVVAALADPHIVAVFDHGEGQMDGRNVMFLVLELLEGRSLAAVCRAGAPTVDDVVDWSRQVCVGLQAAHRAGVVHRDIKPENIWLHSDGTVKILDFGIARRAGAWATRSLTATGMVIGTPAYMAPEQAQGDAGTRTDLYALGCLIHQLLLGEPPFAGDPWQVLAQHATRIPDRLDDRRLDIPAALADLVAELLEKEPEYRPADARSVAERLAAVAATRTVDGVVPARPGELELPANDVPATVSATLLDRRPVRAVRVRSVAGAAAGGGILALQGAWLGNWSAPWPLLVGALVTAVTAAAFWPGPGTEPAELTDRTPGPAPAGALLVLALTLATTVLLITATQLPWWVALLANAVTGPLLLGSAEAVRRTLHRLYPRPWVLADLATFAGMTDGFAAAVVLAGHLPLPGAVAAGAGVWLASSTVIAATTRLGRTTAEHPGGLVLQTR